MTPAERAAALAAAERETPDRTGCPLEATPCAAHGYIHGKEAEELREGLERLIEECAEMVPIDDLRDLLDNIDARDSLAFVEAKNGESRPEHDDLRALLAAEARATAAETRIARNEREAALYEGLVMQALLGKGLASIKTEDAPKLLTRLVERGVEAEWDDAAKGAG